VYPFLLVAGAVLLLTAIIAVGVVRTKPTDLSWTLTIIALMSFVLSIGLLAMYIAEYKSVWPGWVGLVLGIGLFYSPLLFNLLAEQIGLTLPPDNKPDPAHAPGVISNLSGHCNTLGIYLTILAVLSLLFFFITQYREREAKKRRLRFQYIDPAGEPTKNTEKPGMAPKCWQMSRCRPSVRMTCPNYVDHITCWKRRSGCFCDRELANFLIGAVGRGEAQEVMDMQQRSSGQAINAMRSQMEGKGNRPPWSEQKKRCHACPIYVEHQEYKYRNFSWTSFFITAAIAGIAWPFFDMGYKWMVDRLDSLLQNVGSIPGLTADAKLANSPFEYVLCGVLFLLLWGYIIDFLDMFFLEWKL